MKKSLNLFDTTMLVAGSMIGSGIFIVSSDIARSVGSPAWLLLIWIFTGLITLFAALSYGELAGMMPKAGGQFVYLKEAFGKLTAFVYGWTVFMVIQTGVIAAVAVAFAKYTGVFIPFFDENHICFQAGPFHVAWSQLLAIAVIAVLTYINTRGIENGKFIQRLFTSAKLLALFTLIIVGIYFGTHTNTWSQNFAEPWKAYVSSAKDGVVQTTPLSGMTLLCAVGVAMLGSLFSSDAWNNVTFIAGEVEKPSRNIPLGLFFGTCIVTLLYVMANVAYLCLLPLRGDPASTDIAAQGIMFAQKDRVGAAALYEVLGSTAQYFMAALIMVSTFGCNNGLILAGSRLFQSMAKEGLFFKKAAENNRFQVPANALVLQGIWASVLCLSGSYGDLLDYCTFSSLIFYIITISGIFVLRRKMPDAERPYKAFGYPVIPAIYIIVTSCICLDLLVFKTFNTGMGLLIMVLGIPVYFLFNKKQPVLSGDPDLSQHPPR